MDIKEFLIKEKEYISELLEALDDEYTKKMESSNNNCSDNDD